MLPDAINLSPQVSPRLLEEVERLGRRLGLPLSTLELLGQNAKVARAFVMKARAGEGRAFIESLNLDHLARLLESRERGYGFHAVPVPGAVAPLA